MRILTGQITQGAAATEVGVDRTVITRIRTVARNGAIVGLQAEVARLERMVVGQAVELAVGQFQAPTKPRSTDRVLGVGLVVRVLGSAWPTLSVCGFGRGDVGVVLVGVVSAWLVCGAPDRGVAVSRARGAGRAAC